jgi:hypothetical protein
MKLTNETLTRSSYDSSFIDESFYNHMNCTLVISLTNGKKYKYLDVDNDTFNKFMYADSQGLFFNESIRDNFKFEEIKEECQCGKKECKCNG